jgi:hypothetical protein
VSHNRRNTGLTRLEDATRARRKGKKKTWGEGDEERSGHEKIGLGEYETHRAGDETEHKEEHERVKHNGHLTGLAVHKLDVLARGSNENTGAESQKKCRGESDFLGGDIREEHLIYMHIIFSEMCKVIKRSTSHHFLV